MKRKNPAEILAVANHGLANGIPRWDETADQSSPKAPKPSP